jgi:hypothetical protein
LVAPADELRFVARIVVKNPLIHQGLIHLYKKAFTGIKAAADSGFWNVMPTLADALCHTGTKVPGSN